MAIRLLASLVLCAGALAAQVPTVETLGDFGVYVKDSSVGWLVGDLRFLAAATPVPTSDTVTAAASGSGYTVTARSRVDVTTSGPATTVRLADHGDGVGFPGHTILLAGSTDNVYAHTAPRAHELLVRLPATLAGWRLALRLEGAPSANLLFWTGTFGVDVGNDGGFEWERQPTGQVHTATLLAGPAVRAVRLASTFRMAAGATSPDAYDAALTVTLTPVEDACAFTTYASGCGPTYQETDTLLPDRHRFDVAVGGAFAHAPVVLVLGLDPLRLQLTGTCFLEVNPLFTIGLLADGAGHASLRYETFGPLAGTTRLQCIPIDLTGPRIAASNALLADCGN